MRRLFLTVLVAAFLTFGGAHVTRADAPQDAAPPGKPQPSRFVHGLPVYDMEVLRHTPGVTFQRTLVNFQHVNPAAPAGVKAATAADGVLSYDSSTPTTGYGFSYTYNAYNQATGDVYLYAWINTTVWYGIPLCAQAESRTYSYPGYVSVRTTQQFYLSFYGGFSLEEAEQAWTGSSGYSDLLSWCYGTSPGYTWYNFSSFACMASYYCSGSAVSQWSDY